MTDLQHGYLSMFMNVEGVLEVNNSVWQSNQNISDCVTLLRQSISALLKLDETKLTTSSGKVMGKNKLRQQLIPEAFLVKQGIRMYYVFAGDNDQANLYSWPKSRLTLEDEAAFYLTVINISEKATALNVELTAMGVDALLITTLAQDIQDFRGFFKDIGLQKEKRKNVTLDIASEIENTRVMLRNRLDPLISVFAMSQEEMVFKYFNARRIVRKGGKRNYYTVIISGTVTDAGFRKPLANVSITPETKGKSTITNNVGKFTVKMYKKNAKALNFTLDGYEALKRLLPEGIKEHKLRVEVKMKKIKNDE